MDVHYGRCIMKYIKMCRYCGHYFETNSPQKIYCDLQHYRPCPICGKATAMIDNDFSRPQKCCSTECTHKLRQQKFKPRICKFCGKTFIPSSGSQTVCDEIHYRNCEICEKPFTYTIKDELNHVTTCSRQCTKIKMRNNFLIKYDAEHPMQSRIGQENFHTAMLRIHGYAHALQIPESREKAKKTTMDNFGVEYGCISAPCSHAKKSHISVTNRKFKEKLEGFGTNCDVEYPIQNRAFDIIIPDTRTLVEINPTYTHSVLGNHFNKTGLDKYCHRDKTQLAIDNGYKCVHIWDWDNKEIMARMLAPKIRISCDDMELYRLNTKVTNDFLNQNHYIGKCRGQLLCLGLVKDGDIYQVMTFGKPKFDKSHTIQIYRMCTKLGYEIDGGYDRLSRFASEFGLYDIIAYADFSKTDGSEYEAIGMKFDHQTQPRLIWSKDTKYINSTLVISGKSTYHSDQELLDDGWLPVYDCGQRVYIWQ